MNSNEQASAPGWLRIAFPILLPIALNACGSAEKAPPAVTVVNSGCKDFRQITWSVDDTLKTSTDIRRHNRKYAELCPKGAASK